VTGHDVRSSAWQCAADANLEHDPDHERRACAELARLGELVPAPRLAADNADPTNGPAA
jgi:hypothetical protein